MNRTRLYVALLGVIFLAAVGIGLVIGEEDRPISQVAATDAPDPTTTTAPRPTTTRAPAPTTTAAPSTTTTVAPTPTTVRRPPATVAPVVTLPPTTEPPVTEPPPTLAPTTTVQPYDPVKCADINRQYDVANAHDDPTRIPLLKLNGCPPFYW